MSLRTTLLRGVGVAVAAASIGAAGLSGVAQAQGAASGVVTGLADGACVFARKVDIGSDNPYIGEIRGMLDGVLAQRSPICRVVTVPDALLVTADFIDMATLRAAQGVATVEEVLGMRPALEAEIAELERIVAGTSAAGETLDDAIVEAAQATNARAREVAEELLRRAEEGYLTEEMQDLLIEARIEQGQSVYYQTQAGIGVGVTLDLADNLTSEQKATLVVANAASGMTTDFVNGFSGRAQRVFTNFGDIRALGGKIEDAADTGGIGFRTGRMSQVSRRVGDARDEANERADRIMGATCDTFGDGSGGSDPNNYTCSAAPLQASSDDGEGIGLGLDDIPRPRLGNPFGRD